MDPTPLVEPLKSEPLLYSLFVLILLGAIGFWRMTMFFAEQQDKMLAWQSKQADQWREFLKESELESNAKMTKVVATLDHLSDQVGSVANRLGEHDSFTRAVSSGKTEPRNGL
jgi:hypothetical protein